MKQRTARRLAWSVWLITAAMLVALFAMGPSGAGEGLVEGLVVGGILLLGVLAYSTVGAMIASRHPGNAMGWLFQYFSLAFLLSVILDEYTTRALREGLPAAPAAAIASQAAPTLVFGSLPLILLLFPTGRLPSRRWRPVAIGLVTFVLAAAVGTLIRPGLIVGPGEGPSVANPLGVEALASWAGALVWIGGIGTFLLALISVGGLVLRYRRADGDERQQIRWLAYVGALAAALLVLLFAADWIAPGIGDWLWIAFFVTIVLGIPAASGIAVLRYRLFDLDIVVKKTVVFGILAAFITGAYGLVVIGIPTLLFGVGGGLRNFIPFLVAAVLAMAFQPVRRLASRLANRLVYGRRASPYELLSGFAGRLGGGYSVEDVLPRMARVVAEGTGAARATVWLRVGSELHLAGAWPSGGQEEAAVPASEDALSGLPGADRAFPVEHEGELLGALAVDMPRAEPLTRTTEKLLEDLAGQASLILRNVRLIEELRASRQRIVTAQDSRAKTLERNLHDGAQQQLVALTVRLRLAQGLAERDPARVAPMLVEVKAEAQEALDNLRDLARGIYPPLLADQGLAAALEAQARKSPVPVTVAADGVGRFPQEVEAGVYFCCLEALQNVAKYSGAAHAVVRLVLGDRELQFSVEDNGSGFDPAATPRGAGLQNMADRIAALGGTLEVRSAPGQGTTVTGRVPVPGPDGLAKTGEGFGERSSSATQEGAHSGAL